MTRYIIRLREGVDPEAFAGELANVVRVLARLRMVVVDLADDAEAAQLEADPRVEYIEADAEGQPAAVQAITNAWQLDRIDQRALPLDGQYSYDHDGAGVTIYVVDSGIRATHQEFAGRIDTNVGFTAVGGSAYDDNQGHGTKVASVAAGATTGVAKGAQIVSVRVWDTGSISSTDLAAGVDWILANHDFETPAIANISLGWSGGSTIVDDAVNDLLAAGMFVAVAAMNDDVLASTSSPGRLSGVLTVSGTESDDGFATGYNYGEAVDILAPARNVWTALATGDSDYDTGNGTSFAAPAAAGVAALLLEQDPTLVPGQIHGLLRSQATTGQITDVPSGTTDRLLYSKVTVAEPTPVNGPIYTKVGTITKPATTGMQAESWEAGGSWDAEDVTPKVVLFWYVAPKTSPINDDQTYSNNRFGIGVATAGAQYVITSVQQDSSSTNVHSRTIRSDCIIFIHDTGSRNVTSGTLARAALDSLDANGFTINWNYVDDASPNVINYLALGGDGIDDVGLTVQTLTGNTGLMAINELGFSDPTNIPDCLWTFNAGSLTSVSSGTTALSQDSALGIGVATRDAGQWASAGYAGTGSPANGVRVQRTDACLIAPSASDTDKINYRASLHSMHPNGCTLDVAENGGSGQIFIALAIRGGVWAAGSIDQPAATGTQAVTGLGFDPVGLLFGSAMAPAMTDGIADTFLMLGASDDTTARSLAIAHPAGLSGSSIVSVNRSTANPVLISTANDLTPNGIAALNSLDAGGFTLDWTSTDSTGAEVLYLAFAGVTVEPPPVPQNLVAVAVNHESIQLTWEPGVPA